MLMRCNTFYNITFVKLTDIVSITIISYIYIIVNVYKCI